MQPTVVNELIKTKSQAVESTVPYCTCTLSILYSFIYTYCSIPYAYSVRGVVQELVDGACGAPDFDARAVLRVLDLHEDVQLVAQVLPLRLAAMRVLLHIGRWNVDADAS